MQADHHSTSGRQGARWLLRKAVHANSLLLVCNDLLALVFISADRQDIIMAEMIESKMPIEERVL